jgi:hypothetical protein
VLSFEVISHNENTEGAGADLLEIMQIKLKPKALSFQESDY